MKNRIKADTTFINFADKNDGIISPAPENLKITSDNINQIKSVVNNNSTILANLINNPPSSQIRFFKGEIKQFETREDLNTFILNLNLSFGIDYSIFTEKFFLNNNSNSTGTFFSGGTSILTENHLPFKNLAHNHALPIYGRPYLSSGGSNRGLLQRSDLKGTQATTDDITNISIGVSSPQTIYNLIYYKDVITIKFLRNI